MCYLKENNTRLSILFGIVIMIDHNYVILVLIAKTVEGPNMYVCICTTRGHGQQQQATYSVCILVGPIS